MISVNGRELTIVDRDTLILKCHDRIIVDICRNYGGQASSESEIIVLNKSLTLEEVNELCIRAKPCVVFNYNIYQTLILYTDFVDYWYYIFIDNHGIYVKKLGSRVEAVVYSHLGNSNEKTFSEEDFLYFGSTNKSARTIV